MKKIKCIRCGKKILKDNNNRRYCFDCRKQRILEIRRKSGKKWRDSHPEEVRKRHREYKKTHWECMKKYQRERNKKTRLKVISYYGGKCKCCNENRVEFLAIDHINGKGTQHRKKLKVGGSFYHWIIKNNYPKIFQVLCHNCNMALGFYGYCPHKK